MDIDIDLQTTFKPQEHFPQGVIASMVQKNLLKKHTVGFYFQRIPIDEITKFAAIPYKLAEDLGFFKIDFLHLSLLDDFKSKHEIKELLKIEPDWSMLEDKETVEKLFQIHRRYDVVFKLKPKSIEDLSDVISLIRPGKRYLVNVYNEDKALVRAELYKKPDDPTKYYFKRSHSIAYALNIVLQLHLIKAKII